MTLRKIRPTLARASAATVGIGMLVAGAAAAKADPAPDVRQTKPRPSLSPRPIPTPQATITVPTYLEVVARAAGAAIPRNGKVSLVQEVTTDATTRTRITVRPKRARVAIRLRTRDDGSIIVRTRDSRKARVQIRIRADGPDTTPTVWVRTWRVR